MGVNAISITYKEAEELIIGGLAVLCLMIHMQSTGYFNISTLHLPWSI